MAEWSKAPDSSSGLRKRAWVQIPLLTLKYLQKKSNDVILTEPKSTEIGE
ncbi:hypothetical protein ERO13_D03G161401v2 [Gossypium hirsutum]|nr:hypothetical protein ERO13_D03G161401v2 [Gossypium hirsutum]